MSIRARLTNGLKSQFFGQVARVLVQLVNVPLLLAFWGKDVFGEWLILTAFSQYLSISSAGFADATAREMVMAESRKDRDATISYFQSTWGLLTVISLVVFAIVYVLVNVLPIKEVTNISVLSRPQVISILLSQSIIVLLTIQTNLLHCGFICQGRYGEAYFYLALMFLLTNIALFIAASLGLQPDTASIIMLVVKIALFFGIRYILWRNTKWLRYGFSHINFSTIKVLIKPSFASMTTILSNALNIQAMRIVIGMIAGPAAVVVFTALRTLTRFGKMFINSFEQIITPELGIAFGSGDEALMRKLYERLSQVMIWFSICVSIFLMFSGNFILDIWTGGEIAMDFPLFFLLIFSIVINTFWFPSYVALAALNKHFDIANRFLLSNIIMIVLAALFIKLFGVIGAAIALVFSEMIMCYFAIPRAVTLVQLSPTAYFFNAIKPPFFLVYEFRSIISKRFKKNDS